MNVGSLFSGVGGFDLGLERAGHRVVFQCEADPYRRRVLRRHWPDVPIYEDVRELASVGLAKSCRHGQGPDDGAEHGNGHGTSGGGVPDNIDLLCGGFPCQDLSVAGKRAGLAGERSGLFFEFMRIADTLVRPGGWVLIENVPGLLSSNEGRDMGVVIGTLADLGFLDLAYRVVCSRYFGVAQRRRRVFILARRASGRRAFQVLLEPEGSRRHPAEGRQAGKGSAQGTPSGTGDHSVSHPVTSKWAKGSGGPAGDECQNLVSGPLTRRYAKGANTTLDDGALICEEIDPDRVREASRLPRRLDDAAVTAFHATQTPVHGHEFTPALGRNAQIGVLGDGQATTSSPVDLKPDGPRYAAMGDAVTVNVAQWIGERLNEHGGHG